MHTTTILVSKRDDAPVVLMTWQQRVNERDVLAAFEQVDRLLNESDGSCYVLVDIRSNPQFPIAATLKGAAFGPYRNRNMAEWLIVGVNPIARLIERTLTGVTKHDIVRWFDDETEALGYVRCVQDKV